VQIRDSYPEQESLSAFFLHGLAGTRKTFLYNCLYSYLRAKDESVLCVTSSGIAAQLLPGGRTAHSQFKIPLSNDSNSVCNISSNSSLAQLLQQTALIIRDKVLKRHKACFEAVNRTLNDICKVEDNAVFGGIPIVLGGDFAQILPVIRQGSRQATVLTCIQHASIWQQLHILKLKTSMRIPVNIDNQVFLSFLQDLVGNPLFNGQVQIPHYIRLVPTVDELCHQIYPNSLLDHTIIQHTIFI